MDLSQLSQYRGISDLRIGGPIGSKIAESFPALGKLMRGYTQDHPIRGFSPDREHFDELSIHELGHAIDFFMRGQMGRIHLKNFGWDGLPRLDSMTIGQINLECRVFALQELMFRACGIHNNLFKFEHVCIFERKACHKEDKKEEIQAWIAEKSLVNRATEYLHQFEGNFKQIATDTFKYLVHEGMKLA